MNRNKKKYKETKQGKEVISALIEAFKYELGISLYKELTDQNQKYHDALFEIANMRPSKNAAIKMKKIAQVTYREKNETSKH